MKLIYCFCFLLVINYTCKKDQPLVGHYRSISPLLTLKKYAIGIKLNLNKDSTYIHSTCAQITRGKWWVHGDSVYLKCDSVRFIIDSLNYIPKYKKGTICAEDTSSYLIQGNSLKGALKLKNGTTEYEHFEKVQ